MYIYTYMYVPIHINTSVTRWLLREHAWTNQCTVTATATRAPTTPNFLKSAARMTTTVAITRMAKTLAIARAIPPKVVALANITPNREDAAPGRRVSSACKRRLGTIARALFASTTLPIPAGATVLSTRI